MLALYRSGRQAEALDVYQQGRRLLAEELALEPGEALKRLEHAILEHDPALGAPARAARTSPPARKRRSRRALAGALAIIGLGGLAAGLAVALTGGSKKALPVRADSLAVIDTRTNRLVGDVPIDGRPVAIAADDKGVYAAAREGIVWRIDPATRRVVGRIGVSGDVHDLALGFGSVWLADGTDGTVTRIDDRLGGSDDDPPQAGERERAGVLDRDRRKRRMGHARRPRREDRSGAQPCGQGLLDPEPGGLDDRFRFSVARFGRGARSSLSSCRRTLERLSAAGFRLGADPRRRFGMGDRLPRHGGGLEVRADG